LLLRDKPEYCETFQIVSRPVAHPGVERAPRDETDETECPTRSLGEQQQPATNAYFHLFRQATEQTACRAEPGGTIEFLGNS
jgi:hypothetical protein